MVVYCNECVSQNLPLRPLWPPFQCTMVSLTKNGHVNGIVGYGLHPTNTIQVAAKRPYHFYGFGGSYLNGVELHKKWECKTKIQNVENTLVDFYVLPTLTLRRFQGTIKSMWPTLFAKVSMWFGGCAFIVGQGR